MNKPLALFFELFRLIDGRRWCGKWKVWRSRLKSLMVTICCYDILRRQFVTANVNILRPLKRFSELGKRPLMSSCCRRWIGREVIGWFCHFDWWWVLRVISIELASKKFPFFELFFEAAQRFLRCKLLTSLRLIRTNFFISKKIRSFVLVVVHGMKRCFMLPAHCHSFSQQSLPRKADFQLSKALLMSV